VATTSRNWNWKTHYYDAFREWLINRISIDQTRRSLVIEFPCYGALETVSVIVVYLCTLCQWSEEKEQLEERLAELQCNQKNSDQWQLSIEQIKNERDEVTRFSLTITYSPTQGLLRSTWWMQAASKSSQAGNPGGGEFGGQL